MSDTTQITLKCVTDDHFAYFLGEQSPIFDLTLPPGGIDSPEMLRMLRRVVARLNKAGCSGHWLVLVANEVVGLCGYKAPPDAAKCVEIGYGIASARRKLGYATQAVSLVLKAARADPEVEFVVAETDIDNFASRLVLQRNDFVHAGIKEDADGRSLDIWRYELNAHAPN